MIDSATNTVGSEQGERSSEAPAGMMPAEYHNVENVKLTVLAELDRGTISMGELLRLDIGDILPFTRPVGENIDLFAADILIGSAEVLAVNDRLAIRIADVNRKLTSSQAKKNALVNSSSGSAPKIRRLGSDEV